MNRTTFAEKIKREIKYTNRDFGELRLALINYAKNYFPNTYNDFNESSPGMMFIEMAAYVGDVLNFYSDVQLQESFLYTVNERKNLYNLAQGLGYKPKTLVPAQADIEFMQLVPAIGTGNNTRPDFRYAQIIEPGAVVATDDNIIFRTIDVVNFQYSSSMSPTDISVYEVDSNTGAVTHYLLKKTVKAVEGELFIREFQFQDPKIYDKITLFEENVSEIISITDSEGDTWYEVPFLAQDLVPVPIRNVEFNDPKLSIYKSSVPYLLTYKQTEKRFITRRRTDDRLEIQFGAGLSQEADEEIVPNPINVGMGLDYFNRAEEVAIDPVNFLYTKTYGTAPSNTTLTVKYIVSNGLAGNVRSNTLTILSDAEFVPAIEQLDQNIVNDIIRDITVTNPHAAYGGIDKRDLDVMREEAMAHFAAQNRAVTKEDYILRCYTMPDRYGAVAKAYVEQDIQTSKWNEYERVVNPYALNLYVLSYNDLKQFVYANEALKENLRQYLRHYRLMTDAINIKDPYIINIGVQYDIITRPNTNSYEVLLKCNERLMHMLSNNNMQINSPIMLSNIITELDKINGVQSVENLEIVNLTDPILGYSEYHYDLKAAKRNNIIYPSLDPCIFEIKYPKNDIVGRVVDL